MSNASLTPLQIKVLKALAHIGYEWRLTGGGALIIAYTHHRETEDLDLFFKSKRLEHIPQDVCLALESQNLSAHVLQTSPAFARLEVHSEDQRVLLDLVADPVAMIEEPKQWDCDGTPILIDTEHEITVNKLCCLLSRCEVRDLLDLKVLIAAGQSLDLAIENAPKKDSGFSPLTLAWILKGFPLIRLATDLNLEAQTIAKLDVFRNKLIEKLTSS